MAASANARVLRVTLFASQTSAQENAWAKQELNQGTVFNIK
jgi:hypothetical protein